MGFSIERFSRIYDDEDGVYIQVWPDAGGLDCVEVMPGDSESRKHYGDIRLTLIPAQAILLGQALIAHGEEAQKSRDGAK